MSKITIEWEVKKGDVKASLKKTDGKFDYIYLSEGHGSLLTHLTIDELIALLEELKQKVLNE